MSGAFRWHGGRLAEAQAVYGGTDWIDLSTGINPVPWPGAQLIDPDWRALPDPFALADLELAAAEHFGVAARHVCAVPGSEIGLRLVGRILGGPAFHVAPSYRTHAAAFGEAGAVAEPEQAPPGSLLLLANPNNPDGRLYARERLAGLQERADWLVVDEAFADCRPDHSIAPDVADGRQLVVLRSFGKFFGLAGVRLGFVLGPSQIVSECRRFLGDWPVSAAAVAFGRAAYQDREWIESSIGSLAERGAQMDEVLGRHGLSARGACPLFRLVEVGDADALFDRLARRQILTRPIEDQPGWLRFGLPADDAAMDRLDGALRDG